MQTASSSLTCICIFASVLLITASGLVGAASEEDALIQLKQGFGNPDRLRSWNTSINASPCRGWFGVACATNSSFVVSLSLKGLNLTGGNISPSIGDLPNLQIVELPGNGLTGRIPPEINKLTSLRNLDLSNNRLTGELPEDWSNLTELVNLILSGNRIYGAIPAGLMEATSLEKLRLENNNLSDIIPPEIFDGNLPRLKYFAVEFNKIIGSIPPEIGGSVTLRSFYAANNNLTGFIPESIGRLPRLLHFEVDHNGLFGPLPLSIVNLTSSLLTFNVSYNDLSGQIPASFSAKFNDSSAFVGNPSLCGPPLSNTCSLQSSPPVFADRRDPSNRGFNGPPNRKKPSKQTAKIVGVALGVVAGLFVLVILFIIIYRKLQHRSHSNESTIQVQNWFNPDIQAKRRKGRYEIFSRGFQYSYEELVANAGYFDTAHVVGRGRFATVYRSQLPNGSLMAVKVFRYANVASCFEKDIDLLASITHKNLLSINGFYANPVEKAIFYDYIPTGTLYELLHGQANAHARDVALPDWPVRHRIALGVAQAMAYLHRGCGYKILHRDLKSTNILLEPDFNPRVSDYGLVHLVSGRPGGAADLVQTPGYMAPEVLTSKKYTEKGDVYSYGVVLLELITGQKAVSYVGEKAVNLTDWVVRLHNERRGGEAIDPLVLKTCPLPEYLNRCLNLAVLCVDANPNNRPSMAETASVVEGCYSSPSPLRSPEFKVDKPLLPG